MDTHKHPHIENLRPALIFSIWECSHLLQILSSDQILTIETSYSATFRVTHLCLCTQTIDVNHHRTVAKIKHQNYVNIELYFEN
jgi:hypothetical protein